MSLLQQPIALISNNKFCPDTNHNQCLCFYMNNQIDGLAQKRCNSIANALELLCLFYIKPSKYSI